MTDTTKMFLRSVTLTGIFAAFLALSGCADDPSPVGSSLLPRSDLVNIDTVTIVAGTTSGEKAIPFPFVGSRSTIALGSRDGFEAWAFVYFFGFPDSLREATFQSAEVRLHKVYSLGDSLATLSLSVHKALSSWNRITYVFDSLSTPGVFEPTGWSPIVNEDAENVRFSLDTSLVGGWVRAVSDSSYKNYGMLLKPGTGLNVIKGFQSIATDSVALRPTLTLVFTMTGSAQPETLVVSSVLDKFVAGMADTTLLRDSTLVPARGGSAYRGVIGIDVSPVPAHAAIHRAFMDLTFDSTSSLLASNQERSLLALYGAVLNPVQTGNPISDGNAVYRFNVTEFIQAMVRGLGDSKIRLSLADEENTVSLFMMHGSAASDPAKRPKITILYSPTR